MRAFYVLVQLRNEILSLIDGEMNVVVLNSDLGVQEHHVGGVAANGVEDDLLVLDVLCSRVGERLER